MGFINQLTITRGPHPVPLTKSELSAACDLPQFVNISLPMNLRLTTMIYSWSIFGSPQPKNIFGGFLE